MLKTIALIGFAAALAFPPAAAWAQTGTSSSWGSVGYGQKIPTQSLSNFDRQWNQFNQSKEQARNSAEYMRQRYYWR